MRSRRAGEVKQLLGSNQIIQMTCISQLLTDDHSSERMMPSSEITPDLVEWLVADPEVGAEKTFRNNVQIITNINGFVKSLKN